MPPAFFVSPVHRRPHSYIELALRRLSPRTITFEPTMACLAGFVARRLTSRIWREQTLTPIVLADSAASIQRLSP